MKRCLNKTVLNNKEMERNIFQKKIENLNIYNNLFDNSNHKFHRNMKVSASASINSIKKDLFKRNNGIKTFQINNLQLLEGCNSNLNIHSKREALNLFNRLIRKNSDSKIIFKENLYKSHDRYASNSIFKFPEENKMYNKYRININPSINNVNDILTTDNNIHYINSYSLNYNNSFNNDKKKSLTQPNENIKFLNQY